MTALRCYLEKRPDEAEESSETDWSRNKALGIERSCLFALDGRNEALEKSARNIDRTTLTTVSQLNAWDILRNRTLLLTKDGLETILK